MSENILELKNLNKFYGELHALKDINLEVKSGEVVVLLGPSGCGKSTTLRCINGLESIASGEIVIDGEVIDAKFKEWQRIRQKVGMVFLDWQIIFLSCWWWYCDSVIQFLLSFGDYSDYLCSSFYGGWCLSF